MSEIYTEVLSDLPDEEVESLVQLINAVYDVAENGMWKVNGFRTSVKEVKELLGQRRLIGARYRDAQSNPICGCVKLEEISPDIGGLGMLVVDPTYRGKGIGRQLVQAAEDWATDMSFQQMQLELLTPKDWIQPSKEFNKAWYTRRGYIPQETKSFQKDFPHLIPLMATECDYTVWLKQF